jgi:predicted amidophosphoribosyltransferase
MKKGDVTCPICSADIPLAGDEAPGDDLFCTVCGAPLRIKPSEDDWEIEEDF